MVYFSSFQHLLFQISDDGCSSFLKLGRGQLATKPFVAVVHSDANGVFKIQFKINYLDSDIKIVILSFEFLNLKF